MEPFDVFGKSSFSIFLVCLHTIVNCAWSCCEISLTDNINLIWDFFWCPIFDMFEYSRGIKSRDYEPAFIVLIIPPVEKRFKRLTSRIDGPIQLRSKVIEPSFIQPFLKSFFSIFLTTCRLKTTFESA